MKHMVSHTCTNAFGRNVINNKTAPSKQAFIMGSKNEMTIWYNLILCGIICLLKFTNSFKNIR